MERLQQLWANICTVTIFSCCSIQGGKFEKKIMLREFRRLAALASRQPMTCDLPDRRAFRSHPVGSPKNLHKITEQCRFSQIIQLPSAWLNFQDLVERCVQEFRRFPLCFVSRCHSLISAIFLSFFKIKNASVNTFGFYKHIALNGHQRFGWY